MAALGNLMLPRVEAQTIQQGLAGMRVASVGPLRPAATIFEVREASSSQLSLFQLACEDEDDEALAPCGGGILSISSGPAAAPVWLEGEDSIDLHWGESAVVPCATSVELAGKSKSLSIVPNTAAVVRAFRSLWDGTEGFALVANFSQPTVHITPGDVVAAAVESVEDPGFPEAETHEDPKPSPAIQSIGLLMVR